MKIPLPSFNLRFFNLAMGAVALVFTMDSCRPKQEKAGVDTAEATQETVIHSNTLDKEQSNFLASQTTSPIHWQAWNSNLFQQAASERKTIFALIGSGTDANSLSILKRLNQSPASCNLLNNHHVNVLIDSNIHPDIEFFTAALCMRSRTPVATPMLVWFSYEGNPISWSPVGPGSSRDIDELISRMSNTVYQVWRDDPDYVLKNSREDFKRRIEASIPPPMEGDTTGLNMRSIRQVASLFDPTSGSIDGIGNLSPGRYINLLVRAAHHPDSSDSQSAKYLNIASLAADNILVHGLIDPLDGGIFTGIQKTTSALPQFIKTLRGQAFSMNALYGLYQATGNISYLKAAESILAYTEKNLALPDGGYLLGIVYAPNKSQDNPCIWTLEELESALTKEEIQIANVAFGLRGLGNIPLVDDPDRSYFRKNSLTWKVAMPELVQQTGLDPATLNQKLESITKKLAKLRTEKPYKPFVENLSTSGSTALYASACVSAYRATSDPAHLDRAQKTLTFIRENFFDETGKLHRAKFSGKLNDHPATGADLTLVSQAALDLHEVTLDPAWLKFAYELHQSMTTMLANPDTHYINEYNGANYPQAYQTEMYITLSALNNDSTWSLAYANAKRLSLRLADEAMTKQAKALEKVLLRSSSSAPIASIDFLTAESMINRTCVYFKAPVAPGLLAAACKKSCQIIAITDDGSYPALGTDAGQLPAGTATVVSHGKVIGTASSATELDSMVK
ncbi:MAG: thioredoxin domain-containing protein [Akkermansiaceae bacterium]|nr:thioredoxin domain-containing protein [Akkermansiaceae bacterium]